MTTKDASQPPSTATNKETVTTTIEEPASNLDLPNKDAVDSGQAAADKMYDKSTPPPADAPPSKEKPPVNEGGKSKSGDPKPVAQSDKEADASANLSDASEQAAALKLPENSLIGKDALDEIEALRVAQGLSVAQAQEVVNHENKILSNYVEGQKKYFEEKQSEVWYEEIQNHKTLGGDHFAENAEMAKRFVNKYCPAHIKKILNDTAWGNNPVLFEIFSNAGKSMANDKIVNGQVGQTTPQDFADQFYGHGKEAQE